MLPFTWIHVSDVHFRPDNDWKDNEPRRKLLEKVKLERNRRNNQAFNAIFCTGDIAFGELKEAPLSRQYKSAREFLEKLRDACGVTQDHIFIVPGNHDIDRSAIDSMAHATLRRYANEASDEVWRKINADFAGQSKEIRNHLQKLAAYTEFVRSYFPHCIGMSGNVHYGTIIDHCGLKIGIAGLNSAWGCQGGDADKDSVWLAAKCQFDSFSELLSTAHVRIALMHHPIDWLVQPDKDFAEQRLNSEFDFFLHGHTHDLTLTPGQNLWTLRSGAICADQPAEFGFNIVTLDPLNKKLWTKGWKYLEGKNQWTRISLDPTGKNDQDEDIFQFDVKRLPTGNFTNSERVVAPPLGMLSGSQDTPKSSSATATTTCETESEAIFEPRSSALRTIGAQTQTGVRHVLDLIADGSPFEGLVSLAGEIISQPVAYLIDNILQTAGASTQRISLSGSQGSGRLQFLLFVYLGLRAKGRECLFIELDNPRHTLTSIERKLNIHRRRQAPFTVLVYESGAARSSDEAWKVSVALAGLQVIEVSRRSARDGTWQIGNLADRNQAACAYIELIHQLMPGHFTKIRLAALASEFAKMCESHRLAPDYYSAQLFCRNSQQQYGQTIRSQLESRLRALALPSLRSPAAMPTGSSIGNAAAVQRSLIEIAEYAFERENSDRPTAGENARNGVAELHSVLCSQSDHVGLLLIALGQVSKLHYLCEIARQKDQFDARRHGQRLRELDSVQICTVNAFVKEIVNRWDGYREHIASGLLRLLRVESNVPHLLKFRANICYILGRIERKEDRDAIVTELRRLILQVESYKHTLELARNIFASVAYVDGKSQKALTQFRKNIEQMFVENGLDPQRDAQVQITQLERRCLLLARSAYISLSMFGEEQMATEYARKILSSPEESDLNRGFHRAYFLDIKGKRADPLLDTDSDLGDCSGTIDALVKALEAKPLNTSMAALQALTLCCIVRVRLNPLESVDSQYQPTDAQRSAVVDAVSNFLSSAPAPAELDLDVRQALEQLIREIRFGPWALERMIDDLFTLKFQRRVGWGKISRPESVSAHSMFVQFLSAIFGESRRRKQGQPRLPASFPMYHDIGEAIVSDIPHMEKDEATIRSERNVIKAVALMGLTSGVGQIARLTSDFVRFEAAKSGAEHESEGMDDSIEFYNDMDRLELLIQFRRYLREGEHISRESQFRDYVAPNNFSTPFGKALADRFTRYFDSESSRDDFPTEGLWPSPKKLVLVGDVAN